MTFISRYFYGGSHKNIVPCWGVGLACRYLNSFLFHISSYRQERNMIIRFSSLCFGDCDKMFNTEFQPFSVDFLAGTCWIGQYKMYKRCNLLAPYSLLSFVFVWGNYMISNASWPKIASLKNLLFVIYTVWIRTSKFFKLAKLREPVGRVQFVVWQIYKFLSMPKYTRNHVITY